MVGEGMLYEHQQKRHRPGVPLSMRLQSNIDVAMVALAEAWRQKDERAGREALENLVRIAIDDVAPQEPRQTWQPIETAPTDGTRVLVYGWQYGASLFGVGFWFQPRTIKELGGWICETLPGQHVSGTFSNPTHWQPMLHAPVTAPTEAHPVTPDQPPLPCPRCGHTHV
jgi:hypothetical protein